MKPIVISGKIGSGKSTICKLFEDHGYMSISSDMMAKDLIRTNEVIKKSLIESFGADIMHKDDISLKKLRSILCSSEENKRVIDAIVHPVFYRELNIVISSSNDKLVIEIPLIETCHHIDTDYTLIYVETDKDIRKHRFLEKKDTDENIFESLNELQKIKDLSSIDHKYTIFNNGNINDLEDSFNKLYEELDNE
jgi:dephospho-CoA kinase